MTSKTCPPAKTLVEQLALEPHPTEPSTFVSTSTPSSMGNVGNFAYGGCAIGYAINAALLTLPASPVYHLYSALGHFLGPGLTDRPVTARVSTVRQTRTFATRNVVVSQTVDSGEDRPILSVYVDCQIAEPQSIPNMIFSTPPFRTYSPVEQCPNLDEMRRHLLDRGRVDEKTVAFERRTFALGERLVETRPCPEGIFGQNLRGIACEVQHTQEHEPLADRTSGDYFRVRTRDLTTRAQHASALAWIMDASLSFVPLSHDHMWVHQASACSTLDFALRVFANDINLNEWSLRELRSVVGDVGRTYTESRMWDKDGKRLLASMTEQSIARPLKEKRNGKL